MFKATRNERTIDACVKYPVTTNHISQWISINGRHGTINGEGQTSCDKNDKFDKMFGIELAGVRAEINMLKEYEKILIKMTKQPEWRKEKPKEDKSFVEINGEIITPGGIRWGIGKDHVNIFNNNDDKAIRVTVEVL